MEIDFLFSVEVGRHRLFFLLKSLKILINIVEVETQKQKIFFQF